MSFLVLVQQGLEVGPVVASVAVESAHRAVVPLQVRLHLLEGPSEGALRGDGEAAPLAGVVRPT